MATSYRIIGNDGDQNGKPVDDKEVYDSSRLSFADAVKEFSTRKDKFFQIARDCIVKDTLLTFSLYKQKEMRFEILIKADASAPVVVDEKLYALIVGDTASEIVIKENDREAYRAYIDNLSKASKLSEKEYMNRKGAFIRENSKMLMKDLLKDPRSGEKIKEAGSVVSGMTDSIIDNRDMIYNMLSLRKYDYYTYTHCVNVAVLSIGMGIAVGLNGDRVKELGIGAMLHDVGKTAIPPEIVNKQGKLDAYEYRLMQEHVRRGELLLRERKEFPDEAYSAVLEHHEKMSGMGYPNKLDGREIGLYGRITGIADCYDALTTQRSYKAAFSPFEALKIIGKEKSDYDPSLLAEFVKMLGKVAGANK